MGLALLSCLPARADGPVPAASYASWTAHRDAVLRDPALVRFYSFEGLRKTAATSADGKIARPAAAIRRRNRPSCRVSPTHPRPLAGSDRRAARPGIAVGPTASRNEKAFTVEIWFRPHGPGRCGATTAPTDGTLLSVGNGYWDGWRLTAAYPARSVGFEIGRPKPNSSVGIHGGLLPDGVWNHLAATWDGQEMRLYLNGAPAAQGDYRGSYTRPARGDALRIGFAGSGLGSLSLDVDEVAVYGRARTAAEILQSATSMPRCRGPRPRSSWPPKRTFACGTTRPRRPATTPFSGCPACTPTIAAWPTSATPVPCGLSNNSPPPRPSWADCARIARPPTAIASRRCWRRLR